MALSDRQRSEVSKLLQAFCEARIPPAVRDKVRLGFRITGNSVELFEIRPRFLPPHDWHEEAVAKFRYVATRRHWQLYCQHRDLKWHEYRARGPAKSFRALLNEVAADPTGIFWG